MECKQYLQFAKGTYCLIGESIDILARKYLADVPSEAWKNQELRDNYHHHITIFTPEEIDFIERKGESSEMLLNQPAPTVILFELGMAHIQRGNLQSWYVVIYSPDLQSLRKRYGLPEKQLHITIGFYEQDLHGDIRTDLFQCISKHGDVATSLLPCLSYMIQQQPSRKLGLISKSDEQTSPMVSLSIRQEKFLIFHLTYHLMDESLKSNAVTLADSIRINTLRDLGKYLHTLISFSPSFKVEYQQFLEDIAWYLLPKGIFFGLRIVILLQLEKEKRINYDLLMNYFPLAIPSSQIQNIDHFIDHIIELNKLILSALAKQGKAYNKMILTLKKRSTGKESTGDYFLEFATVPRNFSFIKLSDSVQLTSPTQKSAYHHLLAGSAYPSSVECLLALYFSGICHIFTIHEEGIDKELQDTVNNIINQLHYGNTNMMPKANNKSNKKASTGIKVAAASTPLYIQFHFWEVNDRTPPTTEQMKIIISQLHGCVVGKKEAVLVHCQGGVGRTNTVIISYLMMFQDISYAEGHEQVASQRKITLATSQQEFLRRWYQLIREDEILLRYREEIVELLVVPGTRTISNAALGSKAPITHVPEVNYQPIAGALRMPPVVMLVGIPSSGKSTFSKAMVAAYPDYFIRINRDEMRGKGQCEAALQQGLETYLKQERNSKAGGGKGKSSGPTPAKVMLLDNCNVQVEKRKEWIDAAHQVPMWCVFFHRSINECKERIQTRENHPTIQAGKSGLKIIDSMNKMLQIPQLKEGFEQIFTITTDEEMENLLQLWKIPFVKPSNTGSNELLELTLKEAEEELSITTGGETAEKNDNTIADIQLLSTEALASNPSFAHAKPIKFPKIPHLVNLGAATRDDKILSSTEVKTWIQSNYHVIIEEKIDGANIGIWIAADEDGYDSVTQQKKYKNYQIMIQNRSHYINQYYHPQFAKIHLWLETHKYELYSLLVPNEMILYGEWVYAKHSISYDQLPDYFIAYDLYEILKNQFVSRAEFNARMKEKAATIVTVPIVFEGKVTSLQEIVSYVNGQSRYSTTDHREGIVIRIHSMKGVTSSDFTTAAPAGTVFPNQSSNKGKKSCVNQQQQLLSPSPPLSQSSFTSSSLGSMTLMMKCKIVREHFIAGNERWNRSDVLQLNSLAKKH